MNYDFDFGHILLVSSFVSTPTESQTLQVGPAMFVVAYVKTHAIVSSSKGYMMSLRAVFDSVR